MFKFKRNISGSLCIVLGLVRLQKIHDRDAGRLKSIDRTIPMIRLLPGSLPFHDDASTCRG